MSDIICVHGIGQQLLGEDTLLTNWRPALQDGIRRAQGTPPDSKEITMAFYGDLFRKKGTKSFSIPPYDETDIRSGLEENLLLAWWDEAARVEASVPGPEAETKMRTPQLVQRALNALSHSKFFAKVALEALIADLKQVRAYLCDEEIRQKARQRVEDAVTERTRVIVGHSLGTVVAYEALCAHPEWPIRTFVTLGSPLGIRNLIFERLDPPPKGGRGSWPDGVERWINIADGGDIVALVKELNPLFGEGLQDHLVHNGACAHDVMPYLTAEETGQAIAGGLTV